jgi:hypothetical protein
MGRKTQTASTTQLFPKPIFAGPCADPSWNHPYALSPPPEQGVVDDDLHGLPVRHQQADDQLRHACPQVIRAPSGAGEEIVRPVMRPGPRQGLPVSIPHTVRFPDCARKPQASPVNVRNDGAVNSGRTRPAASSATPGPGVNGNAASGSIRGNSFHDRRRTRPAAAGPTIKDSVPQRPDSRPATPSPAGHRPCHG